MPTASQLTQIAQGFSVTPDGQSTTNFKVVPPSGREGPRWPGDMTENLIRNELVPTELDVVWHIKEVVYGTYTEGLVDITAGQKLPGIAGVPGTVGWVGAMVPIPQDVEYNLSFDVAVDVRWAVRDENGQLVADSDVTFRGGAPLPASGQTDSRPQVNQAETTFLGWELTDVLSVSISAAAAQFAGVVELTTPPALPVAKQVARTLTCAVRLRAEFSTATPALSNPPTSVVGDWVELPPIQLPALPIPQVQLSVPTILIFFENANFSGRVLIAIPTSSGIPGGLTVAGITAAITAVETARAALPAGVGGQFGLLSTVLNMMVPGGGGGPILGATVLLDQSDGGTDLNAARLRSGRLPGHRQDHG